MGLEEKEERDRSSRLLPDLDATRARRCNSVGFTPKRLSLLRFRFCRFYSLNCDVESRRPRLEPAPRDGVLVVSVTNIGRE